MRTSEEYTFLIYIKPETHSTYTFTTHATRLALRTEKNNKTTTNPFLPICVLHSKKQIYPQKTRRNNYNDAPHDFAYINDPHRDDLSGCRLDRLKSFASANRFGRRVERICIYNSQLISIQLTIYRSDDRSAVCFFKSI